MVNMLCNIDEKIEEARKKLLDMSMRNSLLNFKHSSSSIRHCRIVDANVNYVFSRLLNGGEFLLKHLPEIPSEPQDEQTPEFKQALERALVCDEKYLKQLEKLEENDDDNLKEKIIRELKDRIREQLGLPERKAPNYTAFRWAKEIGINPDYDNKISIENPNRENKPELQTLFFEDEFNKKIKNIQRIIKSDNEEKGANTFYVAVGFLEWTVSPTSSEDIKQAPLLLIRLNFIENKEKKQKTKKDKSINYYVEAADTSIQVNLPLQKKLKEYNIILPEFTGEDTPDSYFSKVEETIKSQKGWRVRRYITVGRFIFSRIAMYEDLDTSKNWNYTGNSGITQIFRPKPGAPTSSDYDIDKDEEAKESILISPADISQHTTIIEANKGKSMVIQGPPGTGKSQTITNLIANALYQGKKVLFVSEKKAALDVVHKRLKNAKLEDFCLELHSDKTNKKNIVENLKSNYTKYFGRNIDEPLISKKTLDLLKNRKNQLREYYDFLQTPVENVDVESVYNKNVNSRVSICDIIWKIKDIENILKSEATNFYSSNLSTSGPISANRFNEIHRELDELSSAYIAFTDSFQNSPNTFYFDFNNIKSSDVEAIFKKLQQLLYLIDKVAPNIQNKLSDFLMPECITIDSILNLSEWGNSIQELRNSFKIDHAILRFLNTREKIEQLDEILNDIKEYAGYKREVDKNVSGDNAVSFFKTCVEKQHICKTLQNYSLSYEQYKINDFLNLKKDLISFKNNLHTLFYATSILFNTQSCSSNYLFLTADVLEIISKISFEAFNYLNTKEAKLPSTIIVLQKLLEDKRLINSLKSELSIIKNIDNISYEKFQKQYNEFTNRGILSSLSPNHLINKFSINNLFKKKVSSNEKNNYLSELLKFLSLREKINDNENYKEFLPYSIEKIENIIQASQLYQNLLKLSFTQLGGSVNEFGEFLRNIEIEKLSELTSCINSFTPSSLNYGELEKCFSNCSNLNEYEQTINKIISSIDEYLDSFSNKFKSDLNLSEIGYFLSNCQKVCDYNHVIKKKICLLGHHEIVEKLKNKKGIIEIRNTCEYAKKMLMNSLKLDVKTKLFSDENERIIEELNKNVEEVLSDIKQIKLFLSDIHSQIRIKYENYVSKAKSLFSLTFTDYSTILKDLLKLKDYAYCRAHYVQLRKQSQNKEYNKIIDIIESIESKDIQKELYNRLKECFDYVFYLSLLKEYANEEWDNFEKEKFSKICNEIRELDEKIYEEYQKMLISSLVKNISTYKNEENIIGQSNGQTGLSFIRAMNVKRLRPLREIIFRAGKAIQLMKPCFLMSPLSVAQYLTPNEIEFDLLIIDEASQMYFEEALGSLLRCKQYVIVGDENQLPPSSFFQKSILDDDYSDDTDDINKENHSILETCRLCNFNSYELLWHYRSHDDALINFSNQRFYNGDLNVFPSIIDPTEKKKYESGIEYYYDSEATYKSGKKQNEKEAQNIINAISKFVKKHPDKSLGVVAMNSSQQILLEHEKDILLDEDKSFREYVHKWANTQEPFFIKNLENVQGDERDYIFISTVYGPETPGARIDQRGLGPINGVYGHRRLNVLITRAKYGIKLFTSIKASNINVTQASNRGVVEFQKYLAYAETGKLELGELTNHAPDSPFEIAVKSVLEKYGYQVDAQVGCKGFRIDLAVKHPKNTAIYALGIECDGASYHSSKSARDRDCIRQSILEGAGWVIYRIWSTDWYHNYDHEIEKLLKYIEEITKDSPNIQKRKEVFSKDKLNESLSPLQQETLFEIDAKDNYVTERKRTTEKIVEVGDIVEYQQENEIHKYKIISGEADPKNGTINKDTAIAIALLGCVEGEETYIELPNNNYSVIIKSIIKPEIQ